MKKTVLVLMLIALTTGAFAQMKKDRTTAYNYWQKSQDNKAQLLKAKEFIDKAIAYPEAETDAKVWYFRGGIYLDIHISQEVNPLAPGALNTSYEAYNKALKLDTKEEFTNDIKIRLVTIGGQLFNEGITYFTNNEIDNALLAFEQALTISKNNGVLDTLAIYGTALCYEKRADNDKAVEIYQSLVDMKMKEPSVYTSLAMLYKGKNEYEKATAILDAGKQLFPDNTEIIINQANIDIDSKNHKKALESLNVALAKEPGNASILYAMGVTYDLLKNDTTLPAKDREEYYNSAVSNYKKTMEVDPKFFDAVFNLAALIFNRGGDCINAANKLPLSESVKYDKLMEEGNKYLQEALPYFEQALQLRPEDRDTMASLKEIYTRLKMYDKLKEVNERLGQ